MRTRSILAAIAALAILATPVFAAGPFAQVDSGATSIDFRPVESGIHMTLTVSGPEGYFFQQTFGAGETASFSVFDAKGNILPSGSYNWELRAAPEMNDSQRAEMAALRESGADTGSLEKAGKLPAEIAPMSGAFRLQDGSIAAGEGTEATAKPAGGNRLSTKDQVIADDLIVQGSICAGFDCVNNESFGFDTLRLKENNTRIKFEDTSVGTFPSTDWQLTANDSASGGQNRFSIEDITGGRNPFTVEGGSTTNSIYIDSTGRVGFRTSTPVLDIHVNTSNTPAMRLEQNNSGGFTAQTWDIAGNEANFFVRDVTNGSRLPFRIEPGAPTNSITIDSAAGNIGMGLKDATAALHVKRTDGTAKILVEDTTTAGGVHEMLTLQASSGTNDRPRMVFTNNSGTWFYEVNGTNFDINRSGTGSPEEMRLEEDGDMIIGGTLTQLSSRALKHGFEPVDGRQVLDQIANMPMLTWIYNHDTEGTRHVGPMAEDFYAAFQVGPDNKHITVSDQAGIALAAVQGLNQVVEEKDQQIEALRQEIEALKLAVRELAEK